MEYLEQPPDELDCNPYPRGELLLECTASLQSQSLHHHDTPPSTMAVNWYHSQHRPKVGEREILAEEVMYQENRIPPIITLLNNSQDNVSIVEHTSAMVSGGKVLIRSHLEVYGLSESDVGAYWCSIHLNYTSESLFETTVAPSDSVLLRHPREHAHRVHCSTNIAQSKQEKKCALLNSIPPTLPALPRPGNKATIIPGSEVTTITLQISAEQATLVSEKFTEEEEEEGMGLLKEFYVALSILIAFGSVIAALVLTVVCTCVKYRKMLKGM